MVEMPINTTGETYSQKIFKSEIDWKHTKVNFYIKIGITSKDALLLDNIPFLFVFNDIICHMIY